MKNSHAMLSSSGLKNLVGLLIVTLSMGACAGKMSVPGGTANINDTCFNSVSDMQARVTQMTPGTPEGAVLAGLCRKKETLTRLDRREIRIALLGGPDVLFSGTDAESDSEIIRSLYGYKFAYTNLSRKHGFKSPIRIQTDETGYDYTITLIFRDGVLFEKPILSGGLVNKVSSGTLFDFVTPGTILNAGMSSSGL